MRFSLREYRDALEPLIKRVVACAFLLFAQLIKHLAPARSMSLAMASSRYVHNSSAIALVKYHLDKRRETPLDLISEPDTFDDAAKRSLVIQWPLIADRAVASKGIVVISFTSVFPWFLRHCNLSALSEYFHIVLEPSFAGYLDPDILSWAAKVEAPVFVQCTEETDRIALMAIDQNLIPISVGASNWVDHVKFDRPAIAVEKQYDCLYVANSAPFKRAFRYFKAVRNIVDSGHTEFRAAMACADWGDRRKDILAMAEHYGVSDHLDIHFSLSQDKLIELIHRAKVNILLSRKEGSNRSLFESMFCNLPSLCLANVVGPNRAYFNEYTGILAENALLEDALLKIARDVDTFAPRAWAIKNLTPAVTTQRIIDIIEQHQGEKISDKPVLIKINAPEGVYPDTDIEAVWQYHERLLTLFNNSAADQDLPTRISDIADELASAYPELATLHGDSPYALARSQTN